MRTTFIEIHNPELDAEATVSVQAFEKVWSKKGWEKKEDKKKPEKSKPVFTVPDTTGSTS